VNQPNWIDMVLWELHKRILVPERRTAVCQKQSGFAADLGV